MNQITQKWEAAFYHQKDFSFDLVVKLLLISITNIK